ncbi:MAG: hypothetical protein JO219_11320 [Candidatus Eremiobacteraeota bacterium]|nr:hypothetical protein [Candidatus Eremiobacteraeota bacterium]
MQHTASVFVIALRRAVVGIAFALVMCAAPRIAQAQTGSIVASPSVALPGQTVTLTVNLTPSGPSVLHFGDGAFVGLVGPYPQSVPHQYALPGNYTPTLTIIGNPSPIASGSVTVANPNAFSLTAAPNNVLAGQLVNFTALLGVRLPGAYVDFGDGTSAPALAPSNQLSHRYQNPGFYLARLLIVGSNVTYGEAGVNVTANTVNVPAGQIYSSFLVGSPVLAGTDTAIALSYRIFTPFVIGPSGVSPLQAIVELTDIRGNVIQRSDPYALPFTQQTVNAPQTAMIPYTVPADAGGDYLIRVYVRVTQGGTIAVGRAQPLQIIGGADPAPIVSNTFHASGAVLTSSGTNRGGYEVNMGLTTALQWSSEELLLTGTFDPVSKKIDPVLTYQSATPAPVTAPNATSAPNASTSQVDSGQVPAPPTSVQQQPPPNVPTPSPNASAPPANVTPTPPSNVTPAPTSSGPPKAMNGLSAVQPSNADAAPSGANAAPSPSPPTGPSTLTGSAAEQAGPAVTPAPAPAPEQGQTPAPSLNFKDVVGRTDAAMPAVIGSKETVRGLDATYALSDGWTLHGGAGYLQLATNATTERTGELLDIIKAWDAGADAFRLAVSRNEDDVNKFVQTGPTGPLDVSAGVFEFTNQLTPHLKAFITGGGSNSIPETGPMPSFGGSVNQEELAYNVGATTVDVQYHNAAAQFGTLSGASALSDRAGGAATVNLAPSPISSLVLSYTNDSLHSIFTRTTASNATFNIAPPKWPGITVGLERDTALAPGSDALTKTFNIGVSKSGISSLTVNGTIAAVSDSLAPEAYSTTRTGVVTYQYANGAHTFGGGLNATNTTSTAASATVTESVNYGFTFGGHAPPNPQGLPATPTRNFETKLTLTNVNTRALLTGGHTATATGLLSWHVTGQLAPGIEFNYQRHYDNVPSLDTETSFARFRLDVNF